MTVKKHSAVSSINMTPIIDIVFLLIIFFMLVCQFIAAEQYDVNVPDKITEAVMDEEEHAQHAVVTVMKENSESAVCAVGSEKISLQSRAVNSTHLESRIALLIKGRLGKKDTADKTVTLRCDKEVTFGQVKPILTAISSSSCTNVKLAVTQD